MVVVSVLPCITSGSQKCVGTVPAFIVRASSTRVDVYVSSIWVILQVPVYQALVVQENSNRQEAIVCVRKYFVDASIARGCFVFEITGRMASVFISRFSQARSQLLLIITKVLLMISPMKIVAVAVACIVRGCILPFLGYGPNCFM